MKFDRSCTQFLDCNVFFLVNRKNILRSRYRRREMRKQRIIIAPLIDSVHTESNFLAWPNRLQLPRNQPAHFAMVTPCRTRSCSFAYLNVFQEPDAFSLSVVIAFVCVTMTRGTGQRTRHVPNYSAFWQRFFRAL